MQRINTSLFGGPLNLTKKQIKQAVMEHLWESRVDLTGLDKCLSTISIHHRDVLQEILMEQCDYDLHGQCTNQRLVFLDSEINYLDNKTKESNKETRPHIGHRPRCSVQ